MKNIKCKLQIAKCKMQNEKTKSDGSPDASAIGIAEAHKCRCMNDAGGER